MPALEAEVAYVGIQEKELVTPRREERASLGSREMSVPEKPEIERGMSRLETPACVRGAREPRMAV